MTSSQSVKVFVNIILVIWKSNHNWGNWDFLILLLKILKGT